MKVNSEHLFKYINELATNQKVKFKVYYDDCYTTEVLWNGECFEWDTGTFTSEAFFNPLYDFEVIEEDKKIDILELKEKIYELQSEIDLLSNEIGNYHNIIHSMRDRNAYMKETLKDLLKVANKLN